VGFHGFFFENCLSLSREHPLLLLDAYGTEFVQRSRFLSRSVLDAGILVDAVELTEEPS
jgi:hypothetical protein